MHTELEELVICGSFSADDAALARSAHLRAGPGRVGEHR
jgi:hypothetical protein